MKSELDKNKEGLELALRALSSAARIFDDKGLGHFSEAVRGDIRIIEKAIAPDPPEYEEVEEIVGWVNVYQNSTGEVYAACLVHATKEQADENSGEDRISCQPIRVTVKREKKRPVEKSTRIILHEDGTWGYTAGGYPFKTESTAGTFTWHEYPTT